MRDFWDNAWWILLVVAVLVMVEIGTVLLFYWLYQNPPL